MRMANLLKCFRLLATKRSNQFIRKIPYSSSSSMEFGEVSLKKVKSPYDPFFETSISGSTPRSKYGGKYFVTLVPGGGIGPELANAISALFYYANIPIEFDRIDISPASDEEDYLQMLRSIRHCGAAIKGYIEQPQIEEIAESHIRSRNLRLRSALGLYVEVMHFKSHPALKHLSKVSGFDCYLVRPTVEGEYALLEHAIFPGKAVESTKVISKRNTKRLAHYAYQFAIKKGLNNVILVSNPKVNKVATGELFINTLVSVAEDYPDITLEIMSTSVISSRIIFAPESLGVIVGESVSGEALGSVFTGLIGSRGMIARSAYGEKYAVFDPSSRKAYKAIAGLGVVNPTSMLMCGARLLEFLDLDNYASLIKEAVYKTINEDLIHTPDIGGEHSTQDFIANVLLRIQEQMGREIQFPMHNFEPDITLPSEPTAPFDPRKHMPQLADVDLFSEDSHLGA